MIRKQNKQSIKAGNYSKNLIAGRDINFVINSNAPTELVDQKVEEEVEKLRKARFFSEFDRVEFSLNLGRRLEDGDLSFCSNKLKGKGFAWCTRVLSTSDDLEIANNFLELSKTLGDSPESKISEAFIISQKEGKQPALQVLASIDSYASRSAALMIVAHHDGAESALKWMAEAGYEADQLDSDGKSVLLTDQLHLSYWNEATQLVSALSENDFAATPILHHLTALAKLVSVVPPEFRAAVLMQVPFEAKDFPLASDAISMDARQEAHQHFLDAREAAKQLGCPRTASIDDEYALWLELRDPEQNAYGRNRLENKLCDPKNALGFVHYAFQFGIKLDLETVEQDIERSIAINGGMTAEAAIARFALAFTKSTPEEVANYIGQYHSQLVHHIDAKLMRYRQIEMLSRAGLVDRASEVLELMLKDGIPDTQASNLRRIIAESQGSGPIESRKAQYQKTGALRDLINLVNELEDRQRWDDLCEFCRRLFENTRSLRDAERLVNAFNNTHRSGALVRFLKENTDLLSQSSLLRMSFAWGLYQEGNFIESRAAMRDLSDEIDRQNYRALQVNLMIMTGDWLSLSKYIIDEYQNRDQRNAHDLIDAAQMALYLGLPQAKELVFEAVKKANDDPAVFTAAYFIATSAGWVENSQVFNWLEKAAELSGDDGPLQRMSLKDVIDQKPEWERRGLETLRMVAQGQMPIFLAAKSLNRTLIDLTTFPALRNLSTTDPRRRTTIPAYNGKRASSEFDVRGKKVALDVTALLTLSFLKILDVVLDTFEIVYIPHSTLGWLFQERQKASFHQPSRIANAHKIRDFLAKGVLEQFVFSTVSSSDLSARIGDELAEFIAEAEKKREGDDTQHLVIRSSPVHRLSSLMDEEVDLSEHSSVLSSCFSVVRKLRQKGQITSKEADRAFKYLQLHEKQWPNQPTIADGAILYLDDLAVTYFLHLGCLGKLKNAGFRAVVSPRKVSETDALISYDQISEDVKDVIEALRASLNSRIESGHVRLSRSCQFGEQEEKSILGHPSVGILSLASNCDIAIVDDRFINQHANIDNGDAQALVYSTIELLDALVVSGVLSDDDRLEHRTRLRRAGYVFVPVSIEELSRCLRESTIDDGSVVETAELKAIRESILHVRMSDWLQLPQEFPWLDGTLRGFIHVLRNLWTDDVVIEEATARSNWLLDQIDIRGWSHTLVPEHAEQLVRTEHAVYILLLLIPFTDVEQSIEDAYWNWVEERILIPIQEEYPEVYEWLVNWFRNYCVKMLDSPLTEGDNSIPNETISKASAALNLLPPLIRRSLLDDAIFREKYGLKTEATAAFGDSDVSFSRSVLFDAIRSFFAKEDSTKVIDAKGRSWYLTNDASKKGGLPKLILSSGKQRLRLPDFSVFSEDASIRIRFLEESVADVNLPHNARAKWHGILEKRVLEDDEFDTFSDDICDTPVHIERNIKREMAVGKSSISSLVPNSLKYYERLVGVYDGCGSIRDYAVGAGRKVFEQLTEWRSYEGFLFSLLLSSHSALTAEIKTDHLKSEELIKALDYLIMHGDMLSRMGAIEVGLRILSDRPEVEPFLLRLMQRIRDDDVGGKDSEFKLFSSLFILVDGELARTRILADSPPFYRRLASLAQAALIHRELVRAGIDYDQFSKWAFNNRFEKFYMQSLTDMRIESRWSPDFATADQMQADFLGRIVIAGNVMKENLVRGELLDTILGDGDQSIIKRYGLLRPFYSGPLEGTFDNLNALPEEFARIIEGELNSDEVDVASFLPLVNIAMIFRISSDHAELAAKAVRLGKHRLANLESKAQLVSILNGLAMVAAVSRNPALADELRILIRCYRRDSQYAITVEEALKMSLLTSASRADLTEWREFAGHCLSELAFGELEGNDGEILHSRLSALFHSVPELWVSGAMADAALQAWLFR